MAIMLMAFEAGVEIPPVSAAKGMAIIRPFAIRLVPGSGFPMALSIPAARPAQITVAAASVTMTDTRPVTRIYPAIILLESLPVRLNTKLMSR